MKREYLELIWLRGVGALKADAKSSYLGTVWWVLEPLLYAAIFYLAFASGLRGREGTEFALFLICGLLPFKWTQSALGNSATVITNNQGIIGQTYLPKWIFPATTNLSMAIRFTFVMPILLGFVLFAGIEPSVDWYTLAFVIACHLLFNIGMSYLFASTVPLLPDLNQLVPIVILGIMFTSGIFFDINERPEDIQAILRLNPFVQIIDGYRAVLLRGEAVYPASMLYAWLFGLGTLAAGYLTMKSCDRYYPRVLA